MKFHWRWVYLWCLWKILGFVLWTTSKKELLMKMIGLTVAEMDKWAFCYVLGFIRFPKVCRQVLVDEEYGEKLYFDNWEIYNHKPLRTLLYNLIVLSHKHLRRLLLQQHMICHGSQVFQSTWCNIKEISSIHYRLWAENGCESQKHVTCKRACEPVTIGIFVVW